MTKELQKLTDDTFTFSETEEENQFYFFRNDHELLGDVGSAPIVLFAQYLVEKDRKNELKKNKVYKGTICFEISNDHKVIRMTVSDNQKSKPDLHIVRSCENQNMWSSLKEFFKRIFKKKG